MSAAEVGQSLNLKWPSGDTTIDLIATVRGVEESEKVKHGSQFVYTLDCSDGQVRKTRLLNLNWSLNQTDRKRQRDEKKKKAKPIDSLITSNEDDEIGMPASTPGEDNGANKKKKARWTDGRNASTDTIDKSVYVRQIPYAASSKDIEKHFGKEVSNVRLLKDENKKSRGIAFIEFQTTESAIAALGLQGSILQGRPISVSKCVDKETARSQDKARIESKTKEKQSHEKKDNEKDQSKLDLDIIKNLTANCIRSSHGAISNDDFDSRSIEFMRCFDEETLKNALKEFSIIPVIKDKKVANKASYLMGVLKRFQEGKSRPKKGEGSVAQSGDKNLLLPKTKLSVIETSSVEVETCITNAILQSNGKLSRTDFDSRHVSFLQELPIESASAACDEFASYHKLDELRSKGSYFMGILRRHSKGEAAPPPKSFSSESSGGKGKGKGDGKGGKGGKGKGGKGGKGKGGKGKGGKGKGKGRGSN